MPIYEYKCKTCEAQFEKLMRIGADAPPCPECGATEVRKLVSATSFVLKGSGWYRDHYGLKKGKSSSSSEGSSSESSSSSDSSSTASSSSSSSSDSGGASSSSTSSSSSSSTSTS